MYMYMYMYMYIYTCVQLINNAVQVTCVYILTWLLASFCCGPDVVMRVKTNLNTGNNS